MSTFDVAGRAALVGLLFVDVQRKLGPPQSSRLLATAPLEFRVDCGRGVLDWNVILHGSKQSYPANIHGGRIERIGDWAYADE